MKEEACSQSKGNRKYLSFTQTAQYLYMSPNALREELKDGNIIGHKRRDRVIFFVEDLNEYKRKNKIDNSHQARQGRLVRNLS